MTVQLQTNALAAQPRLVVGMIGFSRRQECDVDEMLAGRAGGSVGWRIGTQAEADAWWINGARAQLLADGSLRIGSAEPGGRSVRLALADVSRPIAFSEPLANRDLEPAYSFRIGEPASVFAVLDILETKWLAGTAVRRWLASRMIAAEHALRHRIYHLESSGRLLAVIDRTGEVGWSPGIAVDELEGAQWSARPASAGCIPHAFHRTSVSELVWDHALHCGEELLPDRYRSNRIHFRRPPRIAARLVGDEHLLVMRELVARPASFADLEQRTGLASPQLARALAALYLTGSITTNERRVRQAWTASSASAGVHSTHPSFWSPSRGSSRFEADAVLDPADFTVPVSLSSVAWQPAAGPVPEGGRADMQRQERA